MDTAAPHRPDILLITCDQWRADLARRFGARTPNLDALAATGTRFERHYTQAYPCGPARASLLTGLYPHKHRAITNGTPLDRRHPTLFTELRRAGYRPLLFGYTDTTLDPRGKPKLDPDNGEYEGLCPGLDAELLLTDAARPWLAHLLSRGYAVPRPELGRKGVFAQRGFGEPAPFRAADSETAFLADRFLHWLPAAGPAPFCVHLSFIAPHPPFAAAAPWHEAADPEAMPPPIAGGSGHQLLDALRPSMRLESIAPGLDGPAIGAPAETIRRIRALYVGLAEEVDHHLGRIWAGLRQAGRWKRTLIVFTADHGDQLFDHALIGKTAYFDASAHVPLIIRDPAATQGGRVVERFTEAVDIAPTVLAAAGLVPPRNLDGHSLLPFCGGETPSHWRDAAHWAFDFRDVQTMRLEHALGLPSAWCNLQVVRTERLKYVHFAGLPPVLFDLADDPDETIDRAGDTGRRALLQEGMERLLTWRQRHEEETLTGFLAREGVLYDAESIVQARSISSAASSSESLRRRV